MEDQANRYRELAARLSRLPGHPPTDRPLPRSDLAARILFRLYGRDGAETTVQEVGDAFLHLAMGVWDASCAALMEYVQEEGTFTSRHVMGLSDSQTLEFSHDDSPEALFCIYPGERPTPLTRRLCSLIGRGHLMWAFSPSAGMGLLLGRDAPEGSEPPSFVKEDREIVEDLLIGYVHLRERKRAGEVLRRSEEQSRQSQKLQAVGRLAGGIAHDFNNLMTIVNGYCDYLLIRVGKQSPLRAEILEIKNAGTRAASLTRQLMAFSRRQRLRQRRMDLNGLLEDASSVLRRLISEDNKLVILLEQDLNRVRADSGQIHQVVLNLTLNALDAMPEGGTLTIQTKNVSLGKKQALEIPDSRPGRFVCLSVSDTGIGMNKEVREQIFEPFFSTKKLGEGSGLGLSTVYGIIQQHQGWILVFSEPGKGTTFEVYLPACLEEPEDEETETLSLDGLKGQGERILLVEDDRNVSEFAARVLSENGYEVLEASNSEHALNLFKRRDGDVALVFSDVVLPGKNGIQLADRLLALEPGLRVLLCSGHGDEKSQRPVIEKRGFRFLQKPYSMGELLQAVKEAMR